jgi:hypothetical protein
LRPKTQKAANNKKQRHIKRTDYHCKNCYAVWARLGGIEGDKMTNHNTEYGDTS